MKHSRTTLAFVLTALTAAATAQAQMPRTIAYQGYLATPTGAPVADNNYTFIVKIYDAETSGNVLYTETQSVGVVKGIYNLIIGSSTPGGIPASVRFDRQYWLAVNVNGSDLLPRTQLTTSPYSFSSLIADSARAVAPGAIGPEHLRDGSISPAKLNAVGIPAEQVLVSTGTGVAWQPFSSHTVTSLNTLKGDVEILGGTNIQVTKNTSTNKITVTSLNVGTINTIQSTDDAIVVIDPNGPTTSLAIRGTGIKREYLADSAVNTAKLADNSVTTAKLADNSVTSAKIVDGTIMDVDVNPSAAIAYSKLNLANSIKTADITDGTIINADVSPTAAIAYGKLALTNSIVAGDLTSGAVTLPKIAGTGATANQGIMFDGTNVVWGNPLPGGSAGGDLTGSYPNPTIAANAVTSAKILDGTITNADVSPTAAIAYSKLALTGSIVNADVSATAAIAYSKLALANSIVSGDIVDGTIVNADVSPTAAIAYGKLNLTGSIVNADVSPTAAIAYSKLNLTGGIVNADVNAAAAIAYSKLNLAGSIVNSDVSPTAAIAYSKLNLTNSLVTADHVDGSITLPKLSATGASSGQGITYNGTSIVWGSPSPGGAAGGDLTGTYPNPTIAANAVTSAKILDGTIVNADVSPTAAIAYSKLALSNSIVSGDIVDGTIVNADVSPTAAIAYSKLNLTNSLVTADHVDGSITLPKLSATGASSGQAITYNGTSIVWGSPAPGGAAGGDLTGTYPNPTIAANAVTSAKILDGTIVDADVSPTAAIAYSKLNLVNSIQNADIVPNAITTSKVANGTVTTSKLADSAVSGLKLLTNAVNTAHIADGAVTLPKISSTGASANQAIVFDGTNVVWGAAVPGGAAGGDLTGTYPNPTVANSAITSAKILDGTIVDADVSPTAAIAYSKLNLVNSIQNADIVPNAITTSKVANGTVTTSKLADSAVSGLKLLTAAVNTAHIADGAVTDAKVANGISYSKLSGAPTSLPPSGAAGGDLTGTYPNPVIAANAVTSAKIADGTITNADISAAAAIAYSKLNLSGSVQGSDIAAGTFTTTNAHHALGNNDNTARELRFLEPSGSGVNYTAFKAQAQAGDITYTLPNTAPGAVNQVLQVQAVAGNNATLSWGAIGGGSILFSRTGVTANAGNTSYTVTAADDIIGVNMSAGTNFTVNMPPATTSGKIVIVKIERYNNALLPVLTVQPNGTDKIDGANNDAFGNQNGVRDYYSDGAGNWYSW
ncbi:MAG: hypothetical protein JST22_15920 [Bacteroidetes bacterium]|nr:hypothetical protein [Bacteroidota bacterium]